MSRIIVENRTDLQDEDALELAKAVMQGGRISNNGKQYCYFSVVDFCGSRYGVATDLNKRSDRFVIMDA